MSSSSSQCSPNSVCELDLVDRSTLDLLPLKQTMFNSSFPIDHTRSIILKLAVEVGNLCSTVLRDFPLDVVRMPSVGCSQTVMDHPSISSQTKSCFVEIMMGLLECASTLSITLEWAIRNKMALNDRKYPAELCEGRSGKYTDYSSATGVTKDEGQSTAHCLPLHAAASYAKNANFSDVIFSLVEEIREFAIIRKWSQFHLPRNLVLALLGELGELAELLQWKADEEQVITLNEKDKLSQEIADVSIYLLRLSDVCGFVDFAELLADKQSM